MTSEKQTSMAVDEAPPARCSWCGYYLLDDGACPECMAFGEDEEMAQCSGCGTYRHIKWIGSPHACWRDENGSYEEGGTFQ
jgi:ribosomal protein L32